MGLELSEAERKRLATMAELMALARRDLERQEREFAAAADASGAGWRVIQTEARCENMVSGGLIGRGFDCHVPECLAEERHGRGRTRTVRRPLFPGYVFTKFSIRVAGWTRIYRTAGVRGVLMSGDHPARVPSALVEELKARTQKALQAPPERKFSPGDQVEFVEGAFRYLMGRIDSFDSSGRIVVLMALMGRECRIATEARQIVAA